MEYWCSDIDGVLIDSRELVRESYKHVGVDMPNEAWGHPWKTWLPDAVGSHELATELHERKTSEYVQVLKSGAVQRNALPFARVMSLLERQDDTSVFYVTGATREVAETILSELGLNVENLLAAGVSTDERLEIMQSIAPTGTYVDDRIAGHRPAALAGWNFVWASQDMCWKQ
jgi:phosphoglycolate phosphatase-like HAD superfamily hydrolase